MYGFWFFFSDWHNIGNVIYNVKAHWQNFLNLLSARPTILGDNCRTSCSSENDFKLFEICVTLIMMLEKPRLSFLNRKKMLNWLLVQIYLIQSSYFKVVPVLEFPFGTARNHLPRNVNIFLSLKMKFHKFEQRILFYIRTLFGHLKIWCHLLCSTSVAGNWLTSTKQQWSKLKSNPSSVVARTTEYSKYPVETAHP